MKTIFLAIRDYDVEGYKIAGVFETEKEANAAVEKSKDNGYGYDNYVRELPFGEYFDVGDIDL